MPTCGCANVSSDNKDCAIHGEAEVSRRQRFAQCDHKNTKRSDGKETCLDCGGFRRCGWQLIDNQD